MTRRERLERKLERRQEWAGKASTRSGAAFGAAHRIADVIPMGQPILVGHHSEGRARRDAARIDSSMRKGCDLSDLSKHHESKADGIQHHLNNSVFSDDPDAIEALEARITEKEDERDNMKKINSLYRKGDAAGLGALGLNLETLREGLKTAYSWEKRPYPSYSLTNLGARIRSDRERIKQIRTVQERQAAAQDSPNGVTFTHAGEYVRVTFAEKPEREILTSLKAAGFWWGAGCWSGKTESLPQAVKDVAQRA